MSKQLYYNTVKLYIKYSKSVIKMLPNYIQSAIYTNRELTFIINKNYNILIINFFKKYTNAQYNTISDMCAVDYPTKIYRFEIIYTLLSLTYNSRIKLKAYLKDLESINSITTIFSGANWLEREIYDFFGIFFNNHPDLRRILTDYGFIGHPLRKDFPLMGYFELIYNDVEKCIKRVPIEFYPRFRTYYNYNNFYISCHW
jgi:NADH dehydrogenase (ubiquinone) Fe-S protein 3